MDGGLPVPGQELVDSAHRMTAGHALKDVFQPSVGLDPVELGGLDQGVHDGGALGAAVGAGEQPGLAAERHHPFILPMSVRSWRFITVGIPILAIRFACGALSGEQQANFSRF